MAARGIGSGPTFSGATDNYGSNNSDLTYGAGSNPPPVNFSSTGSAFTQLIEAMLPSSQIPYQDGYGEGSTVGTYSLSHAIRDTVMIMPTIVSYRTLFASDEYFLTSTMAPILQVNAERVSGKTREYLPGMVSIASERGNGTVGSWKESSYTAVLEMYNISMHMTYQLMMIPEGREIMAYQLARMIDSFYDFMNASVVVAYLNTQDAVNRAEAQQLMQNNASGSDELLRLVKRRERDFFDIVRKDKGMKLIAEKLAEHRSQFLSGDEIKALAARSVFIMTNRITRYFNVAPERNTDFSAGGPQAVDQFNRPSSSITTFPFDGATIYFLPPRAMFNNINGLEMLQRRITIGAYYVMAPRFSQMNHQDPNLEVDP